MTNPPIIGAEVWQDVMTLAGDRCQCQGACGKRHTGPNRKPDRCPRVADEYVKGKGRVRLLAIPRDPSLPWHEAARLPARRLIAFCPDCSDGVRRAFNRAAKANPPQADGLFDAEPYTVGRASGDMT
ncbi:hypothetical protein [Streptomyces sp. NBC_00566]|uniref:hypothetical protein n=1 Tax=Streptomyces sp. NBC_00566 TaxID=2975778 RepID=UPI002E808AA3|nr:hypothetical protein [Streptomyces sp. NBC_00566]WUB88228.1 hypothetical protein OG812_17265 [Streptomyces sp. NBC_00566]